MNELTYENKGNPIAKVIIPHEKSKIISIYEINDNPQIDKKDCCKKPCCKKCKGGKCKGGCCKNCCMFEDIQSDEEIFYTEDDIDLLDDGYFKKLPGTRASLEHINKMKKKMKGGSKSKKLQEDPVFHAAKKYINKKKNKEILIHNGEVQLLPKAKTRDVLYVAAPSGSGKSTFLSNYAHEYKKMFPKNPIFLFSHVDKDEVLDKLKLTRVLMDEDLIENPITRQELHDSFTIFDDTDAIQDKKLHSAITALKNDILQNGRHENIYIAITSHLLSNYRETRIVLNESHSITLFPSSGSTYAIKYCLKNYCGFDKKEISRALKLPSRFITIKRDYPQAILYSKGIYLVGQEDEK